MYSYIKGPKWYGEVDYLALFSVIYSLQHYKQ